MGEWAKGRSALSGQTRVYCLIGDPVGHSLSPFIMNRAFGQAGLDCVYVALQVPRERLPEAVSGLKALGIAGANVTYPYKEAVLSFVDHVSERVEVLRAANTLCFTEDGTHAHNTDAPGAALALRRSTNSSLKGEGILIFGAGGAGRAAALGVLEAGASSVVFCERFPDAVEEAVSSLRSSFPDRKLELLSMTKEASEARKTAIGEARILINATPAVGETDAADLVDDPEWIRPGHVCFEFTYHPRVTGFLRMAAARGATCLDGLSLLAAQARESFRLWTGRVFDPDEMAHALSAHAGANPVTGKE